VEHTVGATVFDVRVGLLFASAVARYCCSAASTSRSSCRFGRRSCSWPAPSCCPISASAPTPAAVETSTPSAASLTSSWSPSPVAAGSRRRSPTLRVSGPAGRSYLRRALDQAHLRPPNAVHRAWPVRVRARRRRGLAGTERALRSGPPRRPKPRRCPPTSWPRPRPPTRPPPNG
jgi:hypothetical protein